MIRVEHLVREDTLLEGLVVSCDLGCEVSNISHDQESARVVQPTR
jgi:hypothetical protein